MGFLDWVQNTADEARAAATENEDRGSPFRPLGTSPRSSINTSFGGIDFGGAVSPLRRARQLAEEARTKAAEAVGVSGADSVDGESLIAVAARMAAEGNESEVHKAAISPGDWDLVFDRLPDNVKKLAGKRLALAGRELRVLSVRHKAEAGEALTVIRIRYSDGGQAGKIAIAASAVIAALAAALGAVGLFFAFREVRRVAESPIGAFFLVAAGLVALRFVKRG